MGDSNQPPFNQPTGPQSGDHSYPPYGLPGAQPPYRPPSAQYQQAPYYPGYPPQQYRPAPTQQRKLSGKLIALISAISLVLCVCIVVGIIAVANAGSTPSHDSVSSETAAQYQSSAQSVKVSDLAKEPNAYKGKTVTFRAIVVSFIPDSNGDNTAANVADPADYSTDIAILFSPGLSIQHINKGDIVTVWGQGGGALSGTNAFGGTIKEGVVHEVYLHDATAGYDDKSVTNPAQYVNSLP